MILRPANEADCAAMAAIYAPYVNETDVSWEYEAPDAAEESEEPEPEPEQPARPSPARAKALPARKLRREMLVFMDTPPHALGRDHPVLLDPSREGRPRPPRGCSQEDGPDGCVTRPLV